MLEKPDLQEAYIDCIRTCYPELKIENVRYHNSAEGQFNVIVWINDAIVFRFPRSVEVAETLITALKIIETIQSHLSLPIPQPAFRNLDKDQCNELFIGYWAMPGKPLWQRTLEDIQDEAVLDHIASQLAHFLQELHSIKVDELDLALPVQDGREEWVQMYEDFRTHLFPHMRLDAQKSVTANFDKFLNDSRQFDYVPAFRHGDFGPGNILYDSASRTISGIIDFDSIGVGDPALDVGAILNLGEEFFYRMCRVYPEMAVLRERVEFYRSTYALQEALYGLKDNVMPAFEAGIAAYR